MIRVMLCAMACGCLLSLAASAKAEELKVGDTAPAFTLQASDGKTYSLSDFADKQVVVIAWFPKAFTGGCTKECKSLREFGDDLRQYEVAYFTASCDTAELNTKFAESLSLDYPILSDPSKEVAQAYGVSDGKKNPSRHTIYIGTDGKVLAIDKSVKTDTHGQDVAKRLGELGVAKRAATSQ